MESAEECRAFSLPVTHRHQELKPWLSASGFVTLLFVDSVFQACYPVQLLYLDSKKLAILYKFLTQVQKLHIMILWVRDM